MDFEYYKFCEQNSTYKRYITESRDWWKPIWKLVRNGFGRSKSEFE